MIEKTSFTYKLDAGQQKELVKLLKEGNYRPVKMEYTIYAAETPDCRIAMYTSGKCLVQGKGAPDFVSFILEPCILQQVQLGYEDYLNPELSSPHFGIDESGKGDFFGPMVIAGAYIDSTLIDAMREMDVKDSKNITSDKKAIDMGRALRKLLGNRFTVIKIGPATYNNLYMKMRSVNNMLAWAHARAIENMLGVVPDCPKAISDQFGDAKLIKKALMQKGQKIELVQRHKAESDLAVAAASILAREGFLMALREMSDKFQMTIPKGASDRVKDVATEIAKKAGPNILLETVKCHFKTTDEVLARIGSSRSALPPQGRTFSRAFTYKRPAKSKET